MEFELKKLLLPSIFGFGTFLILILARVILFKILHKWATRTKTKIDDIIIDSFKKPSILWCIAIGLSVGISTSEISPKYTFYLSRIINILIILSITVAIANLFGRILKNYKF